MITLDFFVSEACGPCIVAVTQILSHVAICFTFFPLSPLKKEKNPKEVTISTELRKNQDTD